MLDSRKTLDRRGGLLGDHSSFETNQLDVCLGSLANPEHRQMGGLGPAKANRIGGEKMAERCNLEAEKACSIWPMEGRAYRDANEGGGWQRGAD